MKFMNILNNHNNYKEILVNICNQLKIMLQDVKMNLKSKINA
jgi:hypothetical protein